MTPKFTSKLSKIFGFIIISISGISFVSQILIGPSEVVRNFGLSTLAVLAGLSGLSFSFASCVSELGKKRLLFAGEKFLHASLLVVQVVLLNYISNSLESVQWLKNSMIVYSILKTAFVFLLLPIGIFAFYFCIHGFSDLNDFLWDRYLQRIKENKEIAKSTGSKTDDTWDEPKL